MNTDEIVARLRENKDALQTRGVTHAAVFGSRARGNNREDSDTDILIEVNPKADISIFDYVELKEYIANLLDGHVDVVNRDALKSHVARSAAIDAVYVF